MFAHICVFLKRNRWQIILQAFGSCLLQENSHRLCHVLEMTAVGFEPTPLRTGALSQRLRPFGQTVLKPKAFYVLSRRLHFVLHWQFWRGSVRHQNTHLLRNTRESDFVHQVAAQAFLLCVDIIPAIVVIFSLQPELVMMLHVRCWFPFGKTVCGIYIWAAKANGTIRVPRIELETFSVLGWRHSH